MGPQLSREPFPNFPLEPGPGSSYGNAGVQHGAGSLGDSRRPHSGDELTDWHASAHGAPGTSRASCHLNQLPPRWCRWYQTQATDGKAEAHGGRCARGHSWKCGTEGACGPAPPVPGASAEEQRTRACVVPNAGGPGATRRGTGCRPDLTDSRCRAGTRDARAWRGHVLQTEGTGARGRHAVPSWAAGLGGNDGAGGGRSGGGEGTRGARLRGGQRAFLRPRRLLLESGHPDRVLADGAHLLLGT